ncbi:hypothetical protein LPJ73_004446 [Coemansia sp. RSA 2703]|nr:hypothetical protein LPJ73_004446 [Coemansia sp. RSA 2703]
MTTHVSPALEAAIASEREWLLEQSIPSSLSHIHKSLASMSLVEKTYAKPASGANIVSVKEGHVDLKETRLSECSGTATVSGTAVSQLSFTIANFTHLNQGKPTQFYLKKNEPIMLRQAQDAQNYARLALRKTQNMPQFGSCEEAMCYVEELLKDIQNARRILSAERNHDLMPLQSENVEKFVPSLPENLALECGLEGGSLVVRIYWLSFKRGVKSTGILDAFKRGRSAGHMLVYNGRLAEVKREITLQAPLEDAMHSLSSLDMAAAICADIIGQLHAFDSV